MDMTHDEERQQRAAHEEGKRAEREAHDEGRVLLMRALGAQAKFNQSVMDFEQRMLEKLALIDARIAKLEKHEQKQSCDDQQCRVCKWV